MSRQSDAVRDYFDKNGILRKDVCEATGVASGTLSNVLAGRFGISKKLAHRLAKEYGFDVAFLLSGEGSLFPPAGINIHQVKNNNNGEGAGAIHLDGDAALRAENAQLRDQLDREREEKARLLGIIETLTK